MNQQQLLETIAKGGRIVVITNPLTTIPAELKERDDLVFRTDPWCPQGALYFMSESEVPQ